ncbi:MAG: hypothetical protein ACRD9R_04550 [Pyrinomonadaceae bacterium]
MQVIYATGQPRLLEFAVAEQRQAVPVGAIIFAICDGKRFPLQLDESLFNAITDEEYYTYMALLRDAVEREKERLRDRHTTTTMRRFCNWLSGLVTRDSVAIHQSGS